MAGVKGCSGGPRPNVQKPRVVGSVRWRREQRKKRLGQAAPEFEAGAKPRRKRVGEVVRPEDLSPTTVAVWDALAPHAVDAGTLTPASAWAFRRLCEAIVLERAELARISRDGLMVDGEKHPLLQPHTALMTRVEMGLQRFCLIPMGKEMAAKAEAAQEDEFAEFDRPLAVIQGGKA